MRFLLRLRMRLFTQSQMVLMLGFDGVCVCVYPALLNTDLRHYMYSVGGHVSIDTSTSRRRIFLLYNCARARARSSRLTKATRIEALRVKAGRGAKRMAALDFRAMMAAERAKRKVGAVPTAHPPSPHVAPPPQPPAPPAPQPTIRFSLEERNDRPALSAAHCITGAASRVFHIPEWLSEEEEDALLRCVDSAPKECWTQLRGRKLQQHGGTPGMTSEPLPEWLGSVCDALVRASVFSTTEPANHVLVNEYQPGQGIDAHRDGPLYQPRVAIISLGSHCTFQFLTDDFERRAQTSLLLPRRGLLVFEDDAYERLLHTVPALHVDELSASTHRLDLPSSAAASSFLAAVSARATDAAVDASGDHSGAQATEALATQPPQACLDQGGLPRGRRVSLTVRRVLPKE